MGTIIEKDIPAISIIIPVYNVEKYLVRCLDSVFSQKFDYTLEVIAVEDCSTDTSLQILKAYKKINPELIVIEQPINKKLSIARKTGISTARGKYIMHVDSDDWLLQDALNRLYKKCMETNADVIVYNYVRQNDKESFFVNEIKEEVITSDKLRVQKYFFGAPWNKIVKREFVKDMIYGEVSINSTEDLLYSIELLIRVSNVCLFPAMLYSYFINDESITATVSPKNYLSNQIVVLSQLDKIFGAFLTDDLFKNKVLDYFQKWIFLEFSKIHFWKGGTFVDKNQLSAEFSKSTILNSYRWRQLELAINNKYICLYETSKCFGIKMAISILINGLKK